MKEAKIIIIVLTIVLILLFPFLFFSFKNIEWLYNILISIITGVVVSLITVICQYFVAKNRIKNNIFNCYFDFYKLICVAENQKILFRYPISSLCKKLPEISIDLSRNLSEYSSFVPNKKDKFYRKLNPLIMIDSKKFNRNNALKLIFFPCNVGKFKELMIPTKKRLEEILTDLNSKKFEREFREYEKVSSTLGFNKQTLKK